MPDQIDPYKILQVDSEAEDEVIQAAYRRLARKYHPDLATTADAANRMAAINAAWEMIGEPAKRQAFDRKRAPLKTTPVATTDATGPTQGAAGGDTGAGGSSGAAEPGGSASGARPAGSSPTAARPTSGSAPPTETVSRDWTSGRSTQGSGYEESMHAADGFGAAGPPPGRPSGTVLNFGRYAGWSLGEVARSDVEYIEWLDRAPIGRNYRQEIDEILRKSGRRKSADASETDRRGLFRRR
jgi:curved DNA-binding protein CbpA